MRKLLLLSTVIAVVMLLGTNAHAEKFDLGAGVAVKVDYFHFLDSIIGAVNAQDGVYVGVEAYKQLLFPNFYLGLEAGWTGTSGTLNPTPAGDNIFGLTGGTYHADITYVPIELNAKYIFPLSPCWNLGIGGGASINYVDVNATGTGFDGITVNGFLPGGQFFGELNYKYQNWYFGINVKYQLTAQEGISLYNYSTSVTGDNIRVGGQIGLTF